MGGEDGIGVTTGQPNLYKQDLSKLDVTKLTALSREVISRQATINIGTIGHVAHGKSTIVKAISGVQTVRFKNELERNITIKLEPRPMESSMEMGCSEADDPGKPSRLTQHDLLNIRKKRPGSPRRPEPPVKLPRYDYEIEERAASAGEGSDSPPPTAQGADVPPPIGWGSVASLLAGQDPNTLLPASQGSDCTAPATEDSKSLAHAGQTSDSDSSIPKTFRLKEVRVTLEDIGASLKNFMQPSKSSSKSPKLYEVEEILAKNYEQGSAKYFIKWKGWNSSCNTWEPIRNLVNCTELIEAYEKERIELIKKFNEAVHFQPTPQEFENFMKNLCKKNDDYTLSEDRLKKSILRVLDTNNGKRNQNIRKLVRSIKNDILYIDYCNLREKQLKSLDEWETEINAVTRNRPMIKVENEVDLEGPPAEFLYVDDYLPGKGVVIPEDPFIGCECEKCDIKSNCCGKQSGGSFAYSSKKKLRVPLGTPIYECNKRCACSTSRCQNRVVQHGSSVKLCIFRTANGCGWGVKSLQVIKKGSFVTQYVGEVIDNDEAEKRGKQYDAAGRTYLFDLDYNEGEQCPYTVDAATYGNVSHFINHSCDPNLAVFGVWIDCLDPNLPKLALFATRDIEANEEITFDYMCQSLRTMPAGGLSTPKKGFETGIITTTASPRQRLDLPDGSLETRTRCKCGASTCRQYLF